MVSKHLKDHALAVAKGKKRAAAAAKRALLCFVAADPATVRAQGLAEVMGDIVLTFTGGSPRSASSAPDRFDIEVTLNVNMTSPRSGADLNGPMLLPETPEGTPISTPIRARQNGNAGLRFENVPIGPERRLRIANIRANAYQLGLASGPAACRAVIAIQPRLSSSPQVAIINPVVTIGRPEPGLDFHVRSKSDGEGAPFRFVRPEKKKLYLVTTDGTTGFNVKFREQYPSAFKTRKEEAGIPTEGAAPASAGTRFLVRFYNVPDNVLVFVTTRDVLSGTSQPSPHHRFLKAVLVLGSDANGSGGQAPNPGIVPSGVSTLVGDPIVEVPISVGHPIHTGGFGFAVWEWVSDDPSSPLTSEDVSFRVLFVVKPDENPSGLVTVSGVLAPLSTVSTADPTAPSPRFVDTGKFLPAFLFPPPERVDRS